MANNIKTDIQLLSDATGFQPDFITTFNPEISCSNALAALSLKEKQMQGKIDNLRNQLSYLSDEYELNLCKKCLHPKAMLCPGEYECVNRECK